MITKLKWISKILLKRIYENSLYFDHMLSIYKLEFDPYYSWKAAAPLILLNLNGLVELVLLV